MLNRSTTPSIVISGSFRKYLPEIGQLIIEFQQLGIDVLSPQSAKTKNSSDEFVFLISDLPKDPKVLEQRHLDAIEEADALYIYNPEGYIGLSTAMEMGWAHALCKPIYVKEKPTDITLQNFYTEVATPADIRDKLNERSNNILTHINDRSSLKSLQSYISEMVIMRGFSDEQPKDIMLLMTEEVGELARAVRKLSGLKIDTAKKDKYDILEDELADVFIYLLDLANIYEVDLFTALKAKEQKNSKRIWN